MIKISTMKYGNILFLVLLCSGVLAIQSIPVENHNDNVNEYKVLKRGIRSPTFKRRPLGLLLGGLGHTGGGSGGYGGGNNYVTNINNYGPNHQSHNPHVTVDHGIHGGGGSFAGSAAGAGGYGGNQAQSQSAAFSFGPYSASFSQSQAQSGRGGDFLDY